MEFCLLFLVRNRSIVVASLSSESSGEFCCGVSWWGSISTITITITIIITITITITTTITITITIIIITKVTFRPSTRKGQVLFTSTLTLVLNPSKLR